MLVDTDYDSSINERSAHVFIECDLFVVEGVQDLFMILELPGWSTAVPAEYYPSTGVEGLIHLVLAL